jgi:ADP-ribosylglycohydrolase
MRATPLAVWGYQLNKEDLELAVRLQTLFTHSNELAIGATYLYCLAIGMLIKDETVEKTMSKVIDEARNYDQYRDSSKLNISDYLQQVLDGDKTKLHDPSHQIGFLKIAF